jgi:hypothetical protein
MVRHLEGAMRVCRSASTRSGSSPRSANLI